MPINWLLEFQVVSMNYEAFNIRVVLWRCIMNKAKQEGFLKKFMLTATVSTCNMHFFDANGVINKLLGFSTLCCSRFRLGMIALWDFSFLGVGNIDFVVSTAFQTHLRCVFYLSFLLHSYGFNFHLLVLQKSSQRLDYEKEAFL